MYNFNVRVNFFPLISVQFLFKHAAPVRCDVEQECHFSDWSVDIWSEQAQVLRLCEHGDQEYRAEGFTLYGLVEIYWRSEEIPGRAVRTDD
jgi:hypothetical protein